MRRRMVHGALAGLAGGAAMALVLLLLAERSIGEAVALEAQRSGPADDALFGRGAQQAGGVLASLLYGTAVGAIFAVAFTYLRSRLTLPPLAAAEAGVSEWRAAASLAGIGFLTLFLVPFFKYPANPPAVGDPSTIGRRTALWLIMVAWSVVATWAAWRAARWLRGREVPEHLRLPAVAVVYAVIVVAGLALLPGSPDPVDAPATLIWRFRLASLGAAFALWAVMGTAFGWLRLAAEARGVAAVTRSPGPVNTT